MEWLYDNKFVIREFSNVIQHKMTLDSFGIDAITKFSSKSLTSIALKVRFIFVSVSCII